MDVAFIFYNKLVFWKRQKCPCNKQLFVCLPTILFKNIDLTKSDILSVSPNGLFVNGSNWNNSISKIFVWINSIFNISDLPNEMANERFLIFCPIQYRTSCPRPVLFFPLFLLVLIFGLGKVPLMAIWTSGCLESHKIKSQFKRLGSSDLK